MFFVSPQEYIFCENQIRFFPTNSMSTELYKSGTVFSSEKNMGFSVVANIEASGGNLDVTVEGP